MYTLLKRASNAISHLFCILIQPKILQLMFTKHILTGTLLGALFLYFFGWIFYTMIAADYFESNMLVMIPMRMNVIFIAIGCLIQAFVMSSLYSSLSKGSGAPFSGFQFGLCIGAFVGLGMGMVGFGTYEVFTLSAQLLDAAWSLLYYGFTGLIISWTHKKILSTKDS